MQSKAKTVTDYLKEVPAERQAVLTKMRALCLKYLTGFDESMVYGGPCYARDGVVEVGFMSQKNYIALYILRTDVMKAHKGELTGCDVGKGCIRYSKPEKVDFKVVEKMLRGTNASKGKVC